MTREEAYKIIDKNLENKEYYAVNYISDCEMLTKNRKKAINNFLDELKNYQNYIENKNSEKNKEYFDNEMEDERGFDLQDILEDTIFYADGATTLTPINVQRN